MTRLAALLAAALLASCGAPAPGYDLVVRGGSILDGRGGAAYRADVGVRDGRIAAIGDLSGARATRSFDAAGLVVAPGFVDIHSHADAVLLADAETQERLFEAKIRQGVTTVVVGNCGLGFAPSDAASAPILAGVDGWMTPAGVSPGPLGVGDYLDRLERGGVALNVATLIPHGAVRITRMGLVPGRPTAADLDAMRAAVRRGLDEGAFGLSCGLIYPPGMYSDTDELAALAGVVAEVDGLFTAHVRGSSETLLPATEELVEIAERSGCRVEHSHLEAVGARFFPDVPRVLAIEDAARARGIRITHDVFPYTRAATMMAAIFPPWSLEGGVPRLLDRLRDPGTREKIRRDIETVAPSWPPWVDGGWPHNLVEAVGWDGILVASVRPDGPVGLVGRSIADIAREERRDPFDVVADLMIAEDGRVGQFVAQISGTGDDDRLLRTILAHPAAVVISDAEDYGRGVPHPAHAGAFARALRMSREGVLPLAEMVRRMTSGPAGIVGLEDRGVLRVGAPADLVAFDAARVADRATWTDPRAFAEGIPFVAINGAPVVVDGRYVPGLHGDVLRARRGPAGVNGRR